MLSASTIRKNGNELYSLGMDNQLGSAKRIQHFQNANRLFENGKQHASSLGNSAEWLRCVKSIGICYYRLSSIKEFYISNSREWIIFNFKQSIDAFCQILSNSQFVGFFDGIDIEWMDQIFNKVVEVVEAFQSFLSVDSDLWQCRLVIIGQLCQGYAFESACGESICFSNMLLNMISTKEILKFVIKADEKKDWRNTLSLCVEMDQSIISFHQNLLRCQLLFKLFNFH